MASIPQMQAPQTEGNAQMIQGGISQGADQVQQLMMQFRRLHPAVAHFAQQVLGGTMSPQEAGLHARLHAEGHVPPPEGGYGPPVMPTSSGGTSLAGEGRAMAMDATSPLRQMMGTPEAPPQRSPSTGQTGMMDLNPVGQGYGNGRGGQSSGLSDPRIDYSTLTQADLPSIEALARANYMTKRDTAETKGERQTKDIAAKGERQGRGIEAKHEEGEANRGVRQEAIQVAKERAQTSADARVKVAGMQTSTRKQIADDNQTTKVGAILSHAQEVKDKLDAHAKLMTGKQYFQSNQGELKRLESYTHQLSTLALTHPKMTDAQRGQVAEIVKFNMAKIAEMHQKITDDTGAPPAPGK